jgi:hypothetical protein
MPKIVEHEYSHIGDTQGAHDHDRDLVHELSKRLDSVWRYDQYIANAEDKPEIRDFWRQLKQEDTKTVQRIKQLIVAEVKANCF